MLISKYEIKIIGIYPGSVGAAIPRHQDNKNTKKIEKYAALVVMIMVVLMEMAN